MVEPVDPVHISVPFVPTPLSVVRKAFQLAGLKSGELVYDPGCGDGRTLVVAAKEFGARAVGVEIRRDLFERAVRNVAMAGVEDKVLLLHGSFMRYQVPRANVVFLYLLSSINEKLRPRLEEALPPGARIVSHDFAVEKWSPVRIMTLEEHGRIHRIFYYISGKSFH